MHIRALPDDAGAYRALRVRSLREHPEAFGRTPEEVEPVDAIAARLRVDIGSDFGVLLGGFDGDALVATAGCHREQAVEHRHMGYIWGVYVVPERRRRRVASRSAITTTTKS